MLKLLWPLPIVQLRILGLIWWEGAYFAQNNTTNILLGDTQQTTSELPVTYFWSQTRQNISNLSLFEIWYGFWKCKYLFENIWCHLQQEKLLNFFIPFLLTYVDLRTVKFFPPAESWLVNSIRFKMKLLIHSITFPFP